MKRWLLLLLTVALAAQEPWEAPVRVPQGVRYRNASAGLNKQAYELIQNVLGGAGSGKHLLSDAIIICGPWLTPQLGADLKRDAVPASFKVDEKTLSGICFHKQPGKRDALEAWLRGELKGGFKVRKLSPPELQLLWAIYPEDLEEPLFVAENGKHRFVFVFLEGKCIQVDDFQHASL